MRLSLLLEASLNKLVRENDKARNKRGRTQPIETKLKAYNKGTRKAKFEVKGMTDTYNIFVEFLKPIQPLMRLSKLEMRSSCSCGDYKFRCNQVLAEKYDAAERRYDNGKPPKITNPDGKIVACKHIVKLQKELQNYRFTENKNIQKMRK